MLTELKIQIRENYLSFSKMKIPELAAITRHKLIFQFSVGSYMRCTAQWKEKSCSQPVFCEIIFSKTAKITHFIVKNI